MTETPNVHAQMTQMITGYWVTQIVRGAAHLSLAEQLARGAMTARDIAESQGINEDACARFLAACAALGLVRAEGDRFGSTDLLHTLHAGPGSLRGFALFQGAPGLWLPWGRFLDALQTGERQTLSSLGAELFDYYQTVPDEAAAFTEAMGETTTAVAADVVRLLDTTAYAEAVDVGGAAGELVKSLMLKNPELRGTVFDLPSVAELGASQESSGLGDRLRFVGGDFFESVPAGDLYLLKWILHDWDDEKCVTILRNCRQAMLPGARLVAVEQVLDPASTSPFTQLMDLTMLVVLNGRERTLPQYQRLFSEAGFGPITATQTNSPFMLLSADAA